MNAASPSQYPLTNSAPGTSRTGPSREAWASDARAIVVAAPASPPTPTPVSAAPTRKMVGATRLVQTSPAMMLATIATSAVAGAPQTTQDGRSIAGRNVSSTSPDRRTGTSAVTAATTRMVASDAASQLPR